jgi:hypothetical protein
MNIFQRAGLFVSREYNFLPKAARRGIESVAFTGAGLAVSTAIPDYANLPFAHSVVGTVAGTLIVSPLLRGIQAWLLVRANIASADPPPIVPPIPGSQTSANVGEHHL